MGLRFRKSIRLAPGVRINLGLRGLSMTLGARGASVNVGARGSYVNLGLPGTGISSRTRIDNHPPARAAAAPASNSIGISVKLQDDGDVRIVGQDGSTLPPEFIKKIRTKNAQLLRSWLEEQCALWNKGIDDLLGIHLGTRPPDRLPMIALPQEYTVAKPPLPARLPLTLLARLFKSRRARIEALNAAAAARHAQDVAEWERALEAHNRAEAERVDRFRPNARPDSAWVHDYLGEVVGQIAWPRETTVSLEVAPEATSVLVDIDLPEIEDMPDKSATVAARGLKLNIKERSATQRRREYMIHVHGVIFRVIGDVFSALPRIERVVASGYSQRVNKSTGEVANEYLLSVRVSRPAWGELNFSRLADLDLTSCLAGFELRRDMTATGVFSPIEPFDGA